MAQLSWIHRGQLKNPRYHCIVCHGFGANHNDLANLVSFLDPQNQHAWHFPQAPIQIYNNSFAWFPRASQDLEAALQGNFWSELALYDGPDLEQALATLLSDSLEFSPHPAETIFAGFSQGSMMALLAGLSMGAKAVLAWSSALVARQRLDLLLEKQSNMPIFLSHGRSDNVLEIQAGRALHSHIAAKSTSTWFEFDGGHEIDMNVIKASVKFISQL